MSIAEAFLDKTGILLPQGSRTDHIGEVLKNDSWFSKDGSFHQPDGTVLQKRIRDDGLIFPFSEDNTKKEEKGT